MTPFARTFDGSGRKPRAVQESFFDWLDAGWSEADCHATQAPVGSGKSAMARAIQLTKGGAVITPSNILIDQYADTYRDANSLKGKGHYQCTSGLSCSDWQDVLEQDPCLSCPYTSAKCRARAEPTFFNPMSLYYFNIQNRRRFPVIVVDEAHQLSSMILLLCAKRFRKSVYNFDERCGSEVYLARWMEEQIKKLNKLASVYIGTKTKAGHKKAAEIAEEIESIGMTLSCLLDDPQNYAVYFDKGDFRGKPESFLNVRPIRPPRMIMRRLLECDKLVLLSGTLLPTDVEDLAAGRSVRFVDLPSPIPKERRPIFYKPMPFPVNAKTDPRSMVEQIEKILDANPGRNTIIHTTYDRARKFQPFFKRKVLVNTAADKNETLERFKRDGGVFLAAGCAEGLDLKDDLCRLNIIPHLMTPNLGDPVVAKRRALEDGDKWLALETLKVTIQQAGRSTRHEKDDSTTVVMDPRFPDLVRRYGKDCPRSFIEAIRWSAT